MDTAGIDPDRSGERNAFAVFSRNRDFNEEGVMRKNHPFTAEEALALSEISGAVPVLRRSARAGGGEAEQSRPLSRKEFLRFFPHRLLDFFGAWSKSSSEEGEGRAATFSGPRIARILVDQCHAWAGLQCQLCYLACPMRDHAILMRDLKPVIVAEGCDGCGFCETACKVGNDFSAIDWTPAPSPAKRRR